MNSPSYRILIEAEPFSELHPDRAPWEGKGSWPCFWIGGPDEAMPFVAAYRCRFHLEKEAVIRVHVSGDERYELYLDGQRIGRGSERGDCNHWYFETYDLPLSAGEHIIVGKVWSLGGLAPVAQAIMRHGFILAPQEAEFIQLLGTGVADWEWKPVAGYSFQIFPGTEGAGAKTIIDGDAFPWGVEAGIGVGWEPVKILQAGASALRRNDYWSVHLMTPATLPPMVELPWKRGKIRRQTPLDSADWCSFLQNKQPLLIPAGVTWSALIDLEDYVCAWPELITTGGAGSKVQILWAEALTNESGKGNRNEIEEKTFNGIGDTFLPDGGESRKFEPLWWEAGRYVKITVETAESPLTIEGLLLRETHYPLELQSVFLASDDRLCNLIPILWRSLEMCSHETYMDCPFYEQLMYAGDTRTEILTTYVATSDDRLPRKALTLFAASRLHGGLTQSRYPSRGTQIIPPFALWWVGMVYDHALWRGDETFITSLMPVVRSVMDVFIDRIHSDGLLRSPIGWNFTDWVDGWTFGVPPDGDGISGVINLQFLLVLTYVEKLETFCGRPELAAQARRLAVELAPNLEAAFWNEERGLFADDLAARHFSEHAQCLALLSGFFPETKRRRVADTLIKDPSLARTSVYFSHYLFEAYCLIHRIDALFERLQFWFDLTARGLKTTPETADPCRSECHAWGAHPLYHYFTSILGIRPLSLGFQSVGIAPQLVWLEKASGKMVHPAGAIEVDFQREGDILKGIIVLPSGFSGVFSFADFKQPLHPGIQSIKVNLA